MSTRLERAHGAVSHTNGARLRHRATYHQAVTAYKGALIRAAILRAGGNRSEAARALGLQRTHLARLIRELVVLDLPPRHDFRTRFQRKVSA